MFDRKSARIDSKTLAITIIAFANVDGGRIAIGVEDDGTLTEVDGNTEHVNEFCEGVDRMFREMAEAGLPAPEYRQNEFMVYATIRQAKDAAGQVAGNGDVNGGLNGGLNESQKMTLEYIRQHEGCQVKKYQQILMCQLTP